MHYERNVAERFVAIFLSVVPVLYQNAVQKGGELVE
jgi:hypothetical protein